MKRYKPLLRPAGFATLPSGITWRYVAQPTMHGLYGGPELPYCGFRFGIIETDRALTKAECATYDLMETI